MLSAQQTPADPLRKDSMLQPETSIPSVPTTLDPSKPPNRQHAPLGNGRDGLRAISGPRTTPSSRMTVRLLERKCLAHIDAINNRDFYEDGVVWTDKASFWEAEIGFLSDNRMSLEQYVEAWQVLSRRYPDYAIRCMSMDTVVEEKKGKAEVFANVEVEGMPVGVIRKNVGVASFEMVQGKWLATRFKTLPG